jgi:lipid II:glycine glycyltransferase (peptidoglycan interpeptide bridge formation enzyme)
MGTEYLVERDPEAAEWDAFVAAHPQSHMLQSCAWGELKSAFGWQAERVGLRDRRAVGSAAAAGQLVAGALVLYRRLPLGFCLAYVPKGPLVDPEDEATCGALLDALHRRCRARRAVLLKVEPEAWEDVTGAPWARVLRARGFVPSPHGIQPRRTILVDLAGGEDAVLKRMKSKTRYNIRLSGRKGVRVYPGGAADVAAFTQLMAVTSERNAFGVHTPDYYERAFAAFHPLGMVRLFVAAVGEEPVAGVMVFACGSRAWYAYGASGNKHRNKMPTYAVQWAAIRWAMSRGCRSYDLYGVPDEDEETLEADFAERHDGLWGVYRFKRGFGGRVVRSIGALDYVYNKPLYWLYRRAMALRQ